MVVMVVVVMILFSTLISVASPNLTTLKPPFGR